QEIGKSRPRVNSPLHRANGLLHRRDALAQPRLIPSRRIPVKRALLDRLVERRHRLTVGRLGGLLIALLDGLAQSPQRSTQAGSIGPIGGSALRGLTGALERRKMVSHV